MSHIKSQSDKSSLKYDHSAIANLEAKQEELNNLLIIQYGTLDEAPDILKSETSEESYCSVSFAYLHKLIENPSHAAFYKNTYTAEDLRNKLQNLISTIHKILEHDLPSHYFKIKDDKTNWYYYHSKDYAGGDLRSGVEILSDILSEAEKLRSYLDGSSSSTLASSAVKSSSSPAQGL